jgi:hypothetical protein
MNPWLISRSDYPIEKINGYKSFCDELGNYCFYYLPDENFYHFSKAGWYVQTGYWQLRDEYVDQFSDFSNEDLIQHLLIYHPIDFPSMLKGIYTIVAFHKGVFFVFNDNLSLSRIFSSTGERFFLSNSINCLRDFGLLGSLERKSYQSRLKFGRDVGALTPFTGVIKSIWGEFWELSSKVEKRLYFHPMSIFRAVGRKVDVSSFTDILKRNLAEFEKRTLVKQHAVTLTGGKDARTALALLRSESKDVVGLTYGCAESKDVVFAKKISGFEKLEHLVIDGSSWNAQEILDVWNEIFDFDSAFINQHRAIRFFALNQLFQKYGPKSIWTGYMGGEWLMGIYKDDLVFKDWLMRWVEEGTSWDDLIQREEGDELNIDNCFSFPKEWYTDRKRREFALMCEIGIKHHQQDIELAMQIGLTPQPFMLDIDWMTKIFESEFSFVYQNNRTKNLFKRWSLYELNVKIQSDLKPEWDNIVFGKKGNYTPREFLKGRVAWSLVKCINFFMEKQVYLPSFAYGEAWYLATIDVIDQMIEDKSFLVLTLEDKKDLKARFCAFDWRHYSKEKSYYGFAQPISLYLLFKRFSAETNEKKSNTVKE